MILASFFASFWEPFPSKIHQKSIQNLSSKKGCPKIKQISPLNAPGCLKAPVYFRKSRFFSTFFSLFFFSRRRFERFFTRRRWKGIRKKETKGFPCHFAGPADFLALPHTGTLARLIIKYPACQLLGKKTASKFVSPPKNLLESSARAKFQRSFDRAWRRFLI